MSQVRLPIHRFELPNGVTLAISPNRDNPGVVIRATLRAGAVYETEREAGLAELTAGMLETGAAGGSRLEVAERLESLGAAVNFQASAEGAVAWARCLGRDLPSVLEVMADCWRQPDFPAEELENIRGEMLTDLRERLDDTRTVAGDLTRELLFGRPHPYGRPPAGYLETVSGLTREQVVSFHSSYYRPEGMLLVIAGDIEPGQAESAVREALGDWQPDGEPPAYALPPPAPPRPGRQQVVMSHKSQSDICCGWVAPPRGDPDYYPLDLANLVVGRLGLMGRLGDNVRDTQGLAYYASARLECSLAAGAWLIRAGVNPANLERALAAIQVETERICQQAIPSDELARAKQNLIGSLALRVETNDGTAAGVHDICYFNLGDDYLERYPEIVRSLTAERIQQVARKWLPPDGQVVAVAGPRPEG